MTGKEDVARRSARSEVAFKQAMVRAREEAGLTQQDLAARLGVDTSAIAEMERLDTDLRLPDIRHYLTQCGAALDITIWPDSSEPAEPR